MHAPRQFEIRIRRRVPFLSSFLFGVLVVCLLILGLLYFIMLPTRNSSAEMASGYYILLVPDFLKTLSAYAGIGFIITAPLYFWARLNKPATLSLYDDRLSIAGKEINLSIPARKIDKVFCNDLHDRFRKPKGILQFVVRQKRRKKTTTFRLKHYEQGDEVLNEFNKLENIQFAFYEDNMLTDHFEE